MAVDSVPRIGAPVFIVGSPRSGTTWLYHILLSAGGFAIYRTETHVINVLGPKFGDLRTAELREEFLSLWLSSEYYLRSGVDADVIRQRTMAECRTAADFLRVLMEEICSSQGATRWSDCSPENILYLPELLASFPDAKIIHIVRDGRDVATSMAGQGWIKPLPWHRTCPEIAAGVYWEWITQRGLRAKRNIPVNQYLEVAYHRLVGDYEATLAAIGEFIGHQLDPAYIAKTAIGSVSKPNTSFQSEGTAAGFAPVDRWKNRLDPARARRLELLVGDHLRRLDFETSQQGSAAPLDSLSKPIYCMNFALRLTLKRYVPALRRRIHAPLFETFEKPNDSDPTLRPGDNISTIRRMVSGATEVA